MESTNATVFMAKDIHMALPQPARFFSGVPHGGQGHALEAGVGERVDDGLRDTGKTALGEVRGQHGGDGAVTFEDAHGVDGDGGDQNGDAHVGGGRTDDAGAEDGEHQHHGAHGGDAQVVVHAEVALEGRGGAGDGRGHCHEHHDVEKHLKEPLDLVKGVIEGLEQLLVAGQSPGVVHHHGLAHGQRQKQHGDYGGDDARPAKAHIVGVGLVAGGEAAAGVGGKQHGAHGEGDDEGGLCDAFFFHVRFLPKLV